jgi:PKD repeat protein
LLACCHAILLAGKCSDILKNYNNITFRGRKMKKLSIIFGLMLLVPFINFGNANGPTADFTWTPSNPSTADIIHFTDTSSNQTNIEERVWYFGDGHGSTEKNPFHQYARPGTYTVKLVVKWNFSGSIVYGEATHDIQVVNQPPVADAGPNQVVNKTKVTFDGSGSYDPDGNITSYKWNFGDNTTGEGKIVHHTYSKDGTYTVTLNVTDDFGASDEDTCVVTVDTHTPSTKLNITGSKGENDWYVSNVTIRMEATDNLSGIEETYYRIDKGNWTEYSTAFILSKEGEHLIEYYSIDKAGNKETIKNITIKIDKTKPVVSILTPRERRLYIFGRDIMPTLRMTIIIGKIDVKIDAADNISGISHVKIFVNDEERANLTSPPYEWRWGGDIGRRTLKVVAYNDAGLNSSSEMDVKIYSLFKGGAQVETAQIY